MWLSHDHQVVVAVIWSVTQIALAIIGLFNLSRTRKLRQEVNGRMDALLESTRTAAHAAGVAAEAARALRRPTRRKKKEADPA